MFPNSSLLEDVSHFCFHLLKWSVAQSTLWSLGAKTNMSQLCWSFPCLQQCVHSVLGLQFVLIPIMKLGSCMGNITYIYALQVDTFNQWAWDKLGFTFMCVLFYCFWHLLTGFGVLRVWFSTSVVSDIAIAIALLWHLSWIKSLFRATKRCVSYCHWQLAFIWSWVQVPGAQGEKVKWKTKKWEESARKTYLKDLEGECTAAWQSQLW